MPPADQNPYAGLSVIDWACFRSENREGTDHVEMQDVGGL